MLALVFHRRIGLPPDADDRNQVISCGSVRRRCLKDAAVLSGDRKTAHQRCRTCVALQISVIGVHLRTQKVAIPNLIGQNRPTASARFTKPANDVPPDLAGAVASEKVSPICEKMSSGGDARLALAHASNCFAGMAG